MKVLMKKNTTFDVGVTTQQSSKHSENEDSYLIRTDLGVYGIADGMGGYYGGRIASSTAVEAVAEYLTSSSETPTPQLVSESVQAANFVLFEYSVKNPKLIGMGTTLTLLYLDQKTATIAHVGDSRCYHFRDGKLVQMTQDHTTSTRSNDSTGKLARALGPEQNVSIDVFSQEFQNGDIFILSTDGVHSVLDEEGMKDVLKRCSEKLAQEISDTLVRSAKLHFSQDDISVITIKIGTY